LRIKILAHQLLMTRCCCARLVELTLLLAAASAAAPPTVHREAVYGTSITKGVVYGQALYCSGGNFSQATCATVNLTVDVVLPTLNSSTNVPVPSGPMPVLLGVHGGSHRFGDSSEQLPSAVYFAQRGWIGLSINYRVWSGGKTYGNFPAAGPFGNSSCGPKDLGGAGCAMYGPPRAQGWAPRGVNCSGDYCRSSYFGPVMCAQTSSSLSFCLPRAFDMKIAICHGAELLRGRWDDAGLPSTLQYATPKLPSAGSAPPPPVAPFKPIQSSSRLLGDLPGLVPWLGWRQSTRRTTRAS
jgi:hypothetical protein